MKDISIVVLILTGMAVAQSATFVDNSPPQSPLTLSASKDAKTGECGITAQDNDSRPIVALVVEFDGGTSWLGRMSHDHFFKTDDHVAMHGKKFDIAFQCKDSQKIAMTVKFVQFNDGELWQGSDRAIVKDVAAQRRDAIDYLNEILGSSDVKTALQTIPKAVRDADGILLTARIAMQYALTLESDPSKAAKAKLANAQAHAAWLLDLQ